jgi:hypothetical protein
MDALSDDGADYVLIDAQIQDCHRQVELQCERLARQVRAGQEPRHSRAFLLSLHMTLIALQCLRDAVEPGAKKF